MIFATLLLLFLYAAFVATGKGWEFLFNVGERIYRAVRSYTQGS